MSAPGWIPIRFFARGGEPRVDWLRARGVRFDDPFFNQTVGRLMQHPFHQTFRRVTPAHALEALPAAPPAGLVAHVSRCGSTLVARMLAAAGNRVLPEPDPLDAVLRYRDAVDERRAAWLRGLASAWGAPGERLVVKLDPTSTLDLPEVARAFAAVPIVFLYREPVEVLVSNLRGGQFRPSNLALAARSGVAGAASDEEFGARVLSRFLERALEAHAAHPMLLVRWEELPDAVFTRVLPHLGIAPAGAESDAMRDVARSDAKNPRKAFVRDTDGKRREASPQARAAADRFLRAPFERLEALRAAQVGSR